MPPLIDGMSIKGDEWILHNLGMLYADQGRPSDAETMYERALRGCEKALHQESEAILYIQAACTKMLLIW